MQFFRIGSSAVLLSLTLAAVASPKDQKEIRAVYARLQNAMLTKNVAAIEKLEGPGFSDTEHGQTMDAKQANAEMKQQFKEAHFTHCHIHVTSVKVTGSKAVATSSYEMDAVAKISGKTHKLHMTGSTRDELVKTGHGWLFTVTKDTVEHETMDGKSVPM